MKFSAILLLAAATLTLAAPRNSKRSGLAARIARREAARSGQPLILTEASANARTEALEAGNATHVTLESTNWAGAILTAPPAGQTFNAVSASFTVPTPSKPAGVSGSSFAASAWVGIDGDTAQNAILQTGVDFNLASSGSVSFDAWFEWFPLDSTDFTGIPIKAGDVIAISVVASSSSEGTATIENTSTGVTVSKVISAPDTAAHLQGQNAEWIVEDFEEGDSLVPFADFGTVVFTNTVAKTEAETVALSGASPIILVSSSDKALTSVSISGSDVTVSYV